MIDVETFAAAKAYTDAHGGEGGTSNYNALDNKPQINGVELSGNQTAAELGLVASVEGKGLSTNDYDNTEKEQNAANTGAIEAIVNENGCCNILQNNLTTRDFGGADLTVNADKSITIDGTPNVNNPQVALCDDYTLKAGTYTLSTGLATNSNLYMYIFDVTHTTALGITYQEEGGKATFTLSSDSVVRPLLAIFATSTISNETVYPMLYDARLNPTGYVPYAMTNRELTRAVEEIDGKVTKIIGSNLWDYSFDFSSQYSDKFSFIINFWNTSDNSDHIGCIIGLVMSNHTPVIMFSNVPTVESYTITISGTTLTIAKTYSWAGMDMDALLF